MKRIIIGLFFLILISNFVFAEDYVVDDTGLIIDSPSAISGSIEIARLGAEIENLSLEVKNLRESNSELIKVSDVHDVQEDFFNRAEKKIDEFSAKLLIILLIFYIFNLSSFFLLKAKRLI